MILLTYAENELYRKIASVPEHFFLCIWSFTKSWFLSNQKCIKFTHSLTFNRTFLLLKFLFYNLVFEVCCNIVFIFFCEGSQLCDGNHATEFVANTTIKNFKIRIKCDFLQIGSLKYFFELNVTLPYISAIKET